MKFLQIKNTEDGEPKMLEIGRDFNTIISTGGSRSDILLLNGSITICKLSDCYESRPLLKLYNHTYNTEFYEFDINSYKSNYPQSIVINLNIKNGFTNIQNGFNTLSHNGWFNDLYDADMQYNLGSIFSKKNKIKYLNLYKVACEYIKKNNL